MDEDDRGADVAVVDAGPASEPSKAAQALQPSANELRLGRKVHELEKERNGLAAELAALKAEYPDHSTTIPVTEPSPSLSQPAQIVIPHELMPTLSLLRSHIHHLTRDNEALRYTFMGIGPSNTAKSSPIVAQTSTGDASGSKTRGVLPPGGVQGIDLETVVGKVKELLRENDELGAMVVELGQTGSEEWQKALDGEYSKAVISSLDSDLTHHLSVIQTLRGELDSYKNHFGPLPSAATRVQNSDKGSTDRQDRKEGSNRHGNALPRHGDGRDRRRESNIRQESGRDRRGSLAESRSSAGAGSRDGRDVKDGRGEGGRREGVQPRRDNRESGRSGTTSGSRPTETKETKEDDRTGKRRR